MAKKKAKSTPKKTTSTNKKSHGQLFDSHPNLIWLLPVFLIIAAVAVLMYKNSLNPVSVDNSAMLDATQIPQEINSTTSATEAMEAPTGN